MPVGEPDGEQGRRLGRRQDRHLRPAVGDKLFNVTSTPARRCYAGQSPGEAGAAVQARRHRARRALDIPAIVTGKHDVRPERPHPGHAPRPHRPAARPGRLRRRHEPGAASRSTRARSSTSPGAKVVHVGNFLGVVAPKEYDAIQAAAQLKVKWATPPTISRQREPLEVDARPRQRRQGARPGSRARRADVDAAMKAAAKTSRARSPTTTRCTPRSARRRRRRRDEGQARSSSPTQGRLRHVAAEDRGGAERVADLRPARPRHLLRGLELLRRRCAARRRGPGRGDHVARRRQAGARSSSCAGTSTAGTTTARPRCGTSAGGVDANGKLVAFDVTSFGMAAYYDDAGGVDESAISRHRAAHRAAAAPPTRPTRARSTTSRTAGSSGRPCRAEQLLQDVVAAGAERQQTASPPSS